MNEKADYTIGEVVDILQAEFSDLTISKIRYLESRGLVDPKRTPTGYRKFTQSDLDQLRWVLRQQREHFLPLRVIRERLSSGTRKLESSATGDHNFHDVDPALPPDDSLEITKSEILQRSGLSENDFFAMEQFGLLPKKNDSGGEMYNVDDLLIAQIVSRFLGFGIEPRHLRAYRRAADSEAALLDQRLVGLAGEEANYAVTEISHLGYELKSLLVRRLIH
ncbi:MAG: MerR family transcriptional regulator [Actinomycetota bacterium]|nr:MerR family transcriptional regulator [Actinomycetota bacterium]